MAVIQLCRHTGALKDEVIELSVTSSAFKVITEHPLVTLNGVTYQRDSRDRSVYFDIEVMNLNPYVEDTGIK